jgi:hypothetical protein
MMGGKRDSQMAAVITINRAQWFLMSFPISNSGPCDFLEDVYVEWKQRIKGTQKLDIRTGG